MIEDLNGLLSNLRSIHNDIKHDIKPISTDVVVVADWVRFKCRYGCRAYGKHLCCPPYAPTPEEMRKVVAEYKTAILARFEAMPGPGTDPENLNVRYRSCRHLRSSTVEDIFSTSSKALLAGVYQPLNMYKAAFGISPKW